MQAEDRATITPSTAAEPGPKGPPRLLMVAIAAVGVGLDVLTKTLAVARLEPLVPVPLLGPVLQLRLIRNPGAAFSFARSHTEVFAVLAICVLAFLLVYCLPRVRHRGWATAFGLLTAGVAGNLGDRLFRVPGPMRGHVVDFLELPRFPIFNVADICITCAAVLIIWLSLFGKTGMDGRPHDGDRVREGAQ